MIFAVNASVLLLSHVIFQGHLVPKDFLTVQTPHTVKAQKNPLPRHEMYFVSLYTEDALCLQERALYSKLHALCLISSYVSQQ